MSWGLLNAKFNNSALVRNSNVMLCLLQFIRRLDFSTQHPSSGPESPWHYLVLAPIPLTISYCFLFFALLPFYKVAIVQIKSAGGHLHFRTALFLLFIFKLHFRSSEISESSFKCCIWLIQCKCLVFNVHFSSWGIC